MHFVVGTLFLLHPVYEYRFLPDSHAVSSTASTAILSFHAHRSDSMLQVRRRTVLRHASDVFSSTVSVRLLSRYTPPPPLLAAMRSCGLRERARFARYLTPLQSPPFAKPLPPFWLLHDDTVPKYLVLNQHPSGGASGSLAVSRRVRHILPPYYLDIRWNIQPHVD